MTKVRRVASRPLNIRWSPQRSNSSNSSTRRRHSQTWWVSQIWVSANSHSISHKLPKLVDLDRIRWLEISSSPLWWVKVVCFWGALEVNIIKLRAKPLQVYILQVLMMRKHFLKLMVYKNVMHFLMTLGFQIYQVTKDQLEKVTRLRWQKMRHFWLIAAKTTTMRTMIDQAFSLLSFKKK